MASLHTISTVGDTTAQFSSIIERLLLLTSTKFNDKKQINTSLRDLNKLDYRYLNIVNNDVSKKIAIFIYLMIKTSYN